MLRLRAPILRLRVKSNGSAGVLLIEESDFSAEFREGRWTVKWK